MSKDRDKKNLDPKIWILAVSCAFVTLMLVGVACEKMNPDDLYLNGTIPYDILFKMLIIFTPLRVNFLAFLECKEKPFATE